ncbi:hypothetical protein CEXT_607241, partial [Caerostris extrusa]
PVLWVDGIYCFDEHTEVEGTCGNLESNQKLTVIEEAEYFQIDESDWNYPMKKQKAQAWIREEPPDSSGWLISMKGLPVSLEKSAPGRVSSGLFDKKETFQLWIAIRP